MSDHDLLQRYARAGDQAAFTELVARHLNLVYSAARRQVHPPQLAEDITQSVFLDLARRARDFPSGQPLAPWLHVVTRRTAIDTLRCESYFENPADAKGLNQLDILRENGAPWVLKLKMGPDPKITAR
jgi:RNA polymerase sigma factor (sigma-70 family)